MKNNKGMIFFTVLSLVLYGIAGAIIGSQLLLAEGPELFTVIVGLLAIIVSSYVSLIAHESGHLAFGILTGYNFLSFRIGSFLWQKDNNGKLRLHRYWLANTAGQCLMIPCENYDENSPFFWYNAGGCVVNLICGVVCAILALLINNALFRMIVVSFGCISVVTGLTNALPIKGVTNDGGNIRDLAYSKKAKLAFMNQMYSLKYLSNSISLTKWPDKWFEKPDTTNINNSFEAIWAINYIERLIYQANIEEAFNELEFVLNTPNSISPIHLGVLKMEYIYCAIYLKKSAREFWKYLDKQQLSFIKSMLNNPTILRCKYAIDKYCYNNEKDANKDLQLFDKLAKAYPYKIEIEDEKNLIKLIDANFNQIS